MPADAEAYGWTAGDIATIRRAPNLAEVEIQAGSAEGAGRWLRITEDLVLNILRMRRWPAAARSLRSGWGISGCTDW